MNSLLPGIKDIVVSPTVLTLTLDRECILPELGDNMTDESEYEMVVIGVNKKNHSVQVSISNNISIKENFQHKKKDFQIVLKEMTENLHKKVSIGMLQLLSWDQLEKEYQGMYTTAVIDIVKTLEHRGFIKYGPHDL